MPGLVPGIHVFKIKQKQERGWPQSTPAMTSGRETADAMLTEAATYDELYRNFRWDIPARFNMATACCDRHADGTGRLALIYVDEDGATTRTSFDEVAEMSRRFANVLKADGLARGDRVAVFLSQSLELPIAHLAAFRSGHDLDPAVCAVRRGRAGIPPVEFGSQGDRHRRERLGEAGENPRSSAGAEERLRHRRSRAGRHKIVLVFAEGGVAGFCDRRHLLR